jgi:hypothetical protein
MQQNLPKIAKICQNLPKDNFEEALEHISAIWIFNPRIFHMLFLLFLKIGLCL